MKCWLWFTLSSFLVIEYSHHSSFSSWSQGVSLFFGNKSCCSVGVSPLNRSLLAFKSSNPIDVDVYHIIIAGSLDNKCSVFALPSDFKATVVNNVLYLFEAIHIENALWWESDTLSEHQSFQCKSTGFCWVAYLNRCRAQLCLNGVWCSVD